MKIQVTKKMIKENYKNIILIGYCNAENMLKEKNATMYSAGVYGWSCDYYIIDNETIISTGYSPIGQEVPSEVIKKYESKAESIKISNCDDYSEYTKKLEKVLNDFINEVLK